MSYNDQKILEGSLYWEHLGDIIIAAFLVEHTTAIYSDFLRMKDLLSMQPNINIDLFVVVPDQRRENVAHEISGPSPPTRIRPCHDLPPPLPSCGGRSSRSGGGRIRYMKPEFISGIAEEAASRITHEACGFRGGLILSPPGLIFSFAYRCACLCRLLDKGLFEKLIARDCQYAYYGLQIAIPSARSKSLSLVAISRILQRLITDR